MSTFTVLGKLLLFIKTINNRLLVLLDKAGIGGSKMYYTKVGVYKAIVVPEESSGLGFRAQCKKIVRSFYIGVSWMETARSPLAIIFRAMNGYDEQNTGTEVYDLSQRIDAQYEHDSISNVSFIIMHNKQKFSLLKTCKKKYYYSRRQDQFRSAKASERIYHKISSPLTRYGLFFSRFRILLCITVCGVEILVTKTAEFTAGALGYTFRPRKEAP